MLRNVWWHQFSSEIYTDGQSDMHKCLWGCLEIYTGGLWGCLGGVWGVSGGVQSVFFKTTFVQSLSELPNLLCQTTDFRADWLVIQSLAERRSPSTWHTRPWHNNRNNRITGICTFSWDHPNLLRNIWPMTDDFFVEYLSNLNRMHWSYPLCLSFVGIVFYIFFINVKAAESHA